MITDIESVCPDSETTTTKRTVNGSDVNISALKDEKHIWKSVVDAEHYQDEFLVLMLRERQAEKKHRDPIVECV